ncbi:hypothetical protein KEJ49_02180 [Candidatus Bathyarchaeota archaeon]|nr:hypothetical protein [Candidatus Bathyarchaeota archaeon]
MVGVGERVDMDDKGRITIPFNIRRVVGKRSFRVELFDKDTIILRAFEDRGDLVKKIAGIRLVGDMERASVDAATIKDHYGWVKH